jgi:hypothetical protein
MKYSIAITSILLSTIPQSIVSFAPSSSFTTFSQSKQQQTNYHHDRFNNAVQSRTTLRKSNSSEMKMMFDQLATAISDVAKNIGGRSR